MKAEKNEKSLVKQLCKVIKGSRPTPRSGGVRGWGGDIDVSTNTCIGDLSVEVKQVLSISKAVSNIWMKILQEAHQRMRCPILMDPDITIMRTDDFICLINELSGDEE